MPLLDLSLVTQALLTTLKTNIEGFDVWPAGEVLTASPQPPDKLKGKHCLGLYLFHARETAASKAQDWASDDEAPQRYAPMGLSLYYLLTARSEITDPSQQIYDEQRIMGLALKTMRDYPKLSATSLVRGVNVFPAALERGDNRIALSLMPLQFNEAMQYWTVGSQPLRFSAYYEVSATLLEPERPKTGRGRVLSYGVQVFLRPGPRLDGTRNGITVTLPGESAPRPLDLAPAEVTYLDQFELYGTELSGDKVELLLSTEGWSTPKLADAGWGIQALGNAVRARAQEAVSGDVALPGAYGAAIRVTTFRPLPDGSTRAYESVSNTVGFLIAPKITATPAALTPGAAGTISGRRFDPAALPDGAVQMFVGPVKLARNETSPLGPGEFKVTGVGSIDFRMPAPLTSGDVLPIKVVVNGAESAPRWIDVS